MALSHLFGAASALALVGSGVALALGAPALAPLLLGAAATSAVLAVASSSIFVLDQKKEALITTFGKHTRTAQNPGLNLKWPWPFNAIERVIPTDLQQVQENLATKTKDDLFVNLPIAIQYEINDTGRYYFDNRNAEDNMKKSVSQAVRGATSGKDFQELYSDRDEISNAVIEHVKEQVKEFGINIRRIIIDEPTAPQEVQTAFNEVRASERLKEAAKNKAEAHKIELVARAEAEKTADILRGQGKAGFRQAIFDQYSAQIGKLEAEGVNRKEAVEMMMQAMEQDTLRDVGEKGNLVIVTETGARGSKGPGTDLAALQTLGPIVQKAIEQNNRPRPSAPSAAPGPG